MLRRSWKPLFKHFPLHKNDQKAKTRTESDVCIDWWWRKLWPGWTEKVIKTHRVNFIFQLMMWHIWIAYILSSTLSSKFFTYVAKHETGSINSNSPQRCSVFIMHEYSLEECELNKTERGPQYVLTLWEAALFSAGCKSWNHFGSEWINDGRRRKGKNRPAKYFIPAVQRFDLKLELKFQTCKIW